MYFNITIFYISPNIVNNRSNLLLVSNCEILFGETYYINSTNGTICEFYIDPLKLVFIFILNSK